MAGKNIFEQVGITPVQAVLLVGAFFGLRAVGKKFGLVDSEEKEKEGKLLQASYLSPSYIQTLKEQKKNYLTWKEPNVPPDIAKEIRKSKGVFNDNESKLWGALKRIKNKTQGGVVSAAFYKLYKEDMVGFLNTFNSKDEMAKIFDYFEGLPSGLK